MLTILRGRKTLMFQYVMAAFLVLVLSSGQVSAESAIELGPGSSHPCTTGEVRLELEDIYLDGAPHAYGFIWDIAIDEKKGEVCISDIADDMQIPASIVVSVFKKLESDGLLQEL